MPKRTATEASAKEPPPHNGAVTRIKNAALIQPIINKTKHSPAGRATRITYDDARAYGRGVLSVN